MKVNVYLSLGFVRDTFRMTKALTIIDNGWSGMGTFAPIDIARFAIVSSCASALIAAGSVLPF